MVNGQSQVEEAARGQLRVLFLLSIFSLISTARDLNLECSKTPFKVSKMIKEEEKSLLEVYTNT